MINAKNNYFYVFYCIFDNYFLSYFSLFLQFYLLIPFRIKFELQEIKYNSPRPKAI